MSFYNILINHYNHCSYLELETERTPNNDETIYIPQHPGARPKMLALYDSSESGSVCRVLNQNRGNCGSSAPYSDVRYTCDTEGGTSGSPVISRETNKVIALHHCGGGTCNVSCIILNCTIWKQKSHTPHFHYSLRR